MSNQQIYPTPEEIKAKKKEFLAKTKPKKPKKAKKPSRNSQLYAFLTAIKSQIKESIQNGASNQKIIKAINETYAIKVGAISFAKFCAENNIATNARKRKAKTDIL